MERSFRRLFGNGPWEPGDEPKSGWEFRRTTNELVRFLFDFDRRVFGTRSKVTSHESTGHLFRVVSKILDSVWPVTVICYCVTTIHVYHNISINGREDIRKQSYLTKVISDKTRNLQRYSLATTSNQNTADEKWPARQKQCG